MTARPEDKKLTTAQKLKVAEAGLAKAVSALKLARETFQSFQAWGARNALWRNLPKHETLRLERLVREGKLGLRKDERAAIARIAAVTIEDELRSYLGLRAPISVPPETEPVKDAIGFACRKGHVRFVPASLEAGAKVVRGAVTIRRGTTEYEETK